MSQSNARIKPLQSLNKTSTPVFKLLIFKEEPWVFDFHKSQLLEGQRNSWSIVVDPLASMMHIPAVLIGLQGNPEIVSQPDTFHFKLVLSHEDKVRAAKW